MSWYAYKPYVSVAERKRSALREMEKLRKKGKDIKPIEIEGRKIAKQFWGEAWCEHLESLSDYANRIPRGRTYVRNGSVCHLDIQKGEVCAYVSGSELYQVKLDIKPLPAKKWLNIRKNCTNQISSLLDLLQGKIPESVLEAVTNQKEGLFPGSREIDLSCNCPDYAYMCKHIAAVLYGIGARLDQSPELLFELRGVDVEELIDSSAEVANATGGDSASKNRISLDALGDVFGIEISDDDTDAKVEKPKKKPTARKTKTSAIKKKAPKKKATAKKAKATVAKRKATKKKATASSRLKPVTGKEVRDLRFRFDMTQAEFAQLLGVSVPSVAKWESTPGQLNLREESLRAIKAAKKLSIKRAREELG